MKGYIQWKGTFACQKGHFRKAIHLLFSICLYTKHLATLRNLSPKWVAIPYALIRHTGQTHSDGFLPFGDSDSKDWSGSPGSIDRRLGKSQRKNQKGNSIKKAANFFSESRQVWYMAGHNHAAASQTQRRQRKKAKREEESGVLNTFLSLKRAWKVLKKQRTQRYLNLFSVF